MNEGTMRNILLILFFMIFSSQSFGATCTSISRTANAANSVLTSTKYNLDHDTAYNAINAFDFGCGTAGTLEIDALNATDYAVLLSAPKSGCEAVWQDANTVLVKKCTIAIDNGLTVTTTGTTVAYGCSGCSAEAGTQTAYIYATTASTANTLALKISTTAPDDNGYNSTDRVLAKIYNDQNQNIATSQSVNYGIGNFYPQTAYVYQEVDSGTNGGTFTSGANYARTLNKVAGDISIVTLSSSQFTLQAGVYDILAFVPAYQVNFHKARLAEVTTGNMPIEGTAAYDDSVEGIVTQSIIMGRIYINAATAYEIQHYCTSTKATNGFGVPGSIANRTEIYTTVKITKIR